MCLGWGGGGRDRGSGIDRDSGGAGRYTNEATALIGMRCSCFHVCVTMAPCCRRAGERQLEDLTERGSPARRPHRLAARLAPASAQRDSLLPSVFLPSWCVTSPSPPASPPSIVFIITDEYHHKGKVLLPESRTRLHLISAADFLFS